MIRLSVVDFLNAAPLYWGFTHGYFGDRFEVGMDLPSVCASKLERGRTDVGLVPSIAFQTIEGLSILGDCCIAADGEVKSVVVFSRRRSLSRVRRVAVDPASRASVALLTILLREKWSARPEMVAAGGEPADLLEDFDAALVIGDPALKANPEGLVVHDLAAVWRKLTRLPFVFALWAAAPGIDLGGDERCFPLSRALGVGHLDDIIREARARVKLPAPELETYFKVNLRYRLGERERKGLELFYELAARHGLTRAAQPLRFYGE